MYTRSALLVLGIALAASSTGCKAINKGCYDGFGVTPRCTSCVADCGECGGAGCGKCLSMIKKCVHDKLTCGSGCGELVWDEWIDNPPDCCDPCDNWGGWTGNRICPPNAPCDTGCKSCAAAPLGKTYGKGAVIEHEYMLETGAGAGSNGETGSSGAAPRATRPDPSGGTSDPTNAAPGAATQIPQDVARRPRRRLLFQ